MSADIAAKQAALIEIVRGVGREAVMPRYLKVMHDRKADGSLCTEADLESQRILIPRLQSLVDCLVLGEEMTVAEQQALWERGREGDLWCVDPIDGTSNFVSGLPYFCISVALLRRGRPILGVVHNPVSGEMFAAAAGLGASLDGEPLPRRLPPEQLSRCIAGVAFKRVPRALRMALADQPPYASNRNLGASALDWCQVAAGRLHVYLHGGQQVWDYAAGALILAEAGGVIATFTQDDFWGESSTNKPWNRSVLASLSSNLLDEWKVWVRGAL